MDRGQVWRYIFGKRVVYYELKETSNVSTSPAASISLNEIEGMFTTFGSRIQGNIE